jgi:UDP-2,4-diacetamido-2,4,6-trideoxy-beta-L-altropyranose hydrolase
MSARTSPLVLIRADGGHAVGLGHLMRCLSLSAALRRAGARVVFVTRSRERAVLRKIRSSGCGVIKIPRELPWLDDARRLRDAARDLNARAVVADSYFIDARYLAVLEGARSRLLVVHDGPGGRFAADFVLNQNAGAASARYRGGRTRFLLGPRYALLRPAFAAARERGERAGNLPRMLVMMGGSDAGGLTLKALAALDRLPARFALDVVAGAAYDGLAELRRAAASASHAVKVHHDPADLVGLMRRAALAVTPASTTSYELACLGTPAVLLQDLDNQRSIVKGLSRAGCAAGAGVAVPFPSAALRRVAGRLLEDRPRRERMSRAGRRLVDGAGAARVASLLLGRGR